MRIEISFDDCLEHDLKVANLLDWYDLKATFYYPNVYPAAKTRSLEMKEVYQKLALKGHTIGGHTTQHPPDLKLCTDEDLKFQIEENKKTIEYFFNKKENSCTKFCYPRGRHDQRVRDAVKAAGYTEARTTRVLQIRNDTGDPLQTPTTIHMFPREEYHGVPWLEVANTMLDKALEASETDDSVFFSIWGHSNELEVNNDWDNFEKILERLSTIPAW